MFLPQSGDWNRTLYLMLVGISAFMQNYNLTDLVARTWEFTGMDFHFCETSQFFLLCAETVFLRAVMVRESLA